MLFLCRLAVVLLPAAALAQVNIDTPLPPPRWALQQRALLRQYGEAASEFAARYLDARGYLRCVERWGGNDGPDDAMENFHNWTLVYALGAPENVLDLYRKAWEGHLLQYTRAGMYHQEFITSFDWEHTGEGLAAFHFYALSHPGDPRYLARVRRFAGFYLNEDPAAPNYDPQHKIIRSLHNGSRGPKLTPATERDWGGLPVPGQPERLTRYSTARNIRGDHPLNLAAATLAFNAYALTGERKYRDWLLEYTGAWRDRILANNGNIPTNIGLDGRIGGEWDGKWYGGAFGWNFWPQSNSRNYYMRGPRIALGEAFLLTRDTTYLDPLRRQVENLYAAAKQEGGRLLLPNKHGDNGWYGYTPDQHYDVQRDLYLWTLPPDVPPRLAADPWLRFLQGRNPAYPEQALDAEFERLRRRVQAMRADTSRPETRAADEPQRYNPLSAGTLANLLLGANDPGGSGNVLHAQVFYYDPVRKRAGLPEDVAALVERITPDETVLTLVNVNTVAARTVTVRTGGYGEHLCESAAAGGRTVAVNKNQFDVRLAPGAGGQLRLKVRRYASQPSLRPAP